MIFVIGCTRICYHKLKRICLIELTFFMDHITFFVPLFPGKPAWQEVIDTMIQRNILLVWQGTIVHVQKVALLVWPE